MRLTTHHPPSRRRRLIGALLGSVLSTAPLAHGTPPEWEPLFNGDDLTGWRATVPGTWSVKDGAIRGESPASEKRHSILLSEKEVGDFTAEIEYRAVKGNSGFYFRVERVNGPVTVHGFQAEIDASGRDVGGLYETGGRAWVTKPSAEAIKSFYKPGDWNTMVVTAEGGDVTVRVNGTVTAELKDDPGRRKGFLGLQLHGGQAMEVEFRRIDLRVADAEGAMMDRTSFVAGRDGVQKLAEGFKFTEGPAAGPDGRIYFSDIPNSRIHVFDPATGEVAVFREESGRANGLMFTDDGRLVACEGGNRRLTRTEKDGSVTVLAEKWDGKRLNSPNDLMIDAAGGIYFTDPRYGNQDDRELDVEAVYYLSASGELGQVAADLTKPNGIILSPDGKTLYVADPGAQIIWSYRVDGPGKLSGKTAFAPVGSDGMTVDERGNVYCTWKGEVWIFSAEGDELERIPCPEGPANCTLVGNTLYITARKGFYAVELKVAAP